MKRDWSLAAELFLGYLITALAFLLLGSGGGSKITSDELLAIGVASLSGVPISWLVTFLVRQTRHLDAASRAIQLASNDLGQLIKVDSYARLIRRELSKFQHERHYKLVVRFLDGKFDRSILRLPGISPAEFYKKLTEALAETKVWEGIHQGSIQGLCESADDGPRNSYLRALRGAKSVARRRVVILSGSEFEKEMRDQELLHKFWISGGSEVETYAISEENLGRALKAGDDGDSLHNALHDCALHDKVLLLHYNRETLTVLLGDLKEPKAVKIGQIFDLLDEELMKERRGESCVDQFVRVKPSFVG